MTQGVQGSKKEKVCHMVSELNLVPVEREDGRRGSCQVPRHKTPTLDQVEMAIVKVEKADVKEVHKAKKLAKQMIVVEVSSTKKLPRTSKDEKEKTSKPLNPESGEGEASTKKESSKGGTSKDNTQVVKQLGSTFNFLESNEKEKENPKKVNIPKKPIKALKRMEEPKRLKQPKKPKQRKGLER